MLMIGMAHGLAHGSGGCSSPGCLPVLTVTQHRAWSTSGPWSPVVDEPYSLVPVARGLLLEPAVTCVLGSRHFSSLHAIFGAHVPRCALDARTSGELILGGQPALSTARRFLS
jgi:hypothetical protein